MQAYLVNKSNIFILQKLFDILPSSRLLKTWKSSLDFFGAANQKVQYASMKHN
jgi:hypothetical protein